MAWPTSISYQYGGERQQQRTGGINMAANSQY